MFTLFAVYRSIQEYIISTEGHAYAASEVELAIAIASHSNDTSAVDVEHMHVGLKQLVQTEE